MSHAARPLRGELGRRLAATERSAGAAARVALAPSPPAYSKAGSPSDSDFPTPPPNGTSVVDTSTARVYFRVGRNDWRWIGLNR